MPNDEPITSARAGRVYTVPASEPFLTRLAEAILMGHLPAADGIAPHPLDLPDITILLPTRRAARALQQAFLSVSGKTALLLPSIRPIAEGEEDLSLLAGLVSRSSLTGGPAGEPDDIAPAVGELERRLVLTEMVMAWSASMRARAMADDADDAVRPATLSAGASTPAQAAHLAAELARLLDMIETEQASLSAISALVPEEHAAHWQQTVEFLKILTEFWPAHLAESGRLSRAAHVNASLAAEARRLETHPPKGPVIVAGVTGSIPAAADLMAVVARLDRGAIVLPGLDQTIDAQSWARLLPEPARDPGRPGHAGHPEHPQFGFARLLSRIGVARDDVAVLPGAEPPPEGAARLAFLSQTLRPAESTSAWHDYAHTADKAALKSALAGVTVIAAPSAQDEAEVAALILREAAETPGRTAALVSPDRMLARRVLARLDTWGIRADDSAGRPFRKTVAGTLFDQIVEAVATGFAPAAVVGLLRHPLARFGLDISTARQAARTIEIAVFRTAYLGRGIEGIETALEVAAQQSQAGGERRERAVRRIGAERWAAARDLVERLKQALAAFETMFADPDPQPLRVLATAHAVAAEAVARAPDRDDNPIWDEEAGRAASLFFTGLFDSGLRAPAVAAVDYPDLYRTLVAAETVRPRVPVHPRIFIWGPYEARLQQADVLVLGSLNEGTWPEPADPGPWLNRPMRAALALPSPEEDIGRAAHDFVSLAAAPTVYLTRAQKVDGVPTVPSRWLLRIEALLAGLDLKAAVAPHQPWLAWARARDAAQRANQIAPPRPRPPVALRPRRMSVTKVETWIANPYAVFASDILQTGKTAVAGRAARCGNARRHHPRRARPLRRALAGAPARRSRRRADADRCRSARRAQAQSARRRLLGVALCSVSRSGLPRPSRRAAAAVARIVAETTALHPIEAPAGAFTLTARADRIDVAASGIVITDYKTGTPPSDRRVRDGLAPQLPLEAGLAALGAFANVPQHPVTALRYIRASGGEPPGEERVVKVDDIAALGQQALENLAALVRHYDDECDALRRTAASPIPLRLRRLRASGARQGMVPR